MNNPIDDLILAGCTKFAHWFQRLTGKTDMAHLITRLVQTEFTVGLTAMNAARAIEMLGRRK